MSGISKTVADSTTGLDLYIEQVRDVSAMRSSLLQFDKTDPAAARKAVQNVTLLRFYHQLERIVRYTEMIDKIEDKMYQSIELKLENSDPDDEDLWLTLIPMQERLQKMMIESHKLLEPYLSPEMLAPLEIEKEDDPSASFTSMLLDQESREKVRTGVQQLMEIINTFDQPADAENDAVQSKAQQALAQLDNIAQSSNSEEG
jgi:hypothetical protein